MASKPQLWSGRFKEPVDERVKRFSASVGFDQRLARHDIAGSLAHARMLAAAGIIGKRDLTAIERGLARIRREIEEGRFEWSLDAEDVHLNIERRLTASPARAVRRRSMLRWTSSASRDHSKRPSSISRRMRASPRSMAVRSRLPMMPAA